MRRFESCRGRSEMSQDIGLAPNPQWVRGFLLLGPGGRPRAGSVPLERRRGGVCCCQSPGDGVAGRSLVGRRCANRPSWFAGPVVAVVVRWFSNSARWSAARVLAPFDGLAHQMVGWRIGSRGANPPSRRSTHEMGRSGQVRSDTQRRAGTGTGGLGPEPVGWDRKRWGGTGSGGVGQGIACLRPPRPVSGHQTWTDPGRTRPPGPPGPTQARPPPFPPRQCPRAPTRHRPTIMQTASTRVGDLADALCRGRAPAPAAPSRPGGVFSRLLRRR